MRSRAVDLNSTEPGRVVNTVIPTAQTVLARRAEPGLPACRADLARLRGNAIEFGAHLPLMDFGGHPYTLAHLIAYTTTAAQLSFGTLSVNDHMVFSVPWLDGPVALAAVMEHSERMTLATTVALAVVRGPVPVAKTWARSIVFRVVGCSWQ